MSYFLPSIYSCLHSRIPAHIYIKIYIKCGKTQGRALTDWSVTSGTRLTTMLECQCRTKCCKLYRHSGIHACPLSKYMLHDQSRAACTCPCCMSMSILHVHVHVACPCQCCMPMSMFVFIYIEMLECRTVQHPVSPVLD
jgi:hypothetical protein